MLKNLHFLLKVYLVFGIFDLLSFLLLWETLHWLVKPMLMPILILYWLVVSKKVLPLVRWRWVVVAALFFSWLGDVFLLFDHLNAIYFILGLSSFLTAHILYILVFLRYKRPSIHSPKVWMVRWLGSIAVIALAASLFLMLYASLGEMLAPVSFYVVVISLMAVMAFFRYDSTNSLSFFSVVLGALLFVISDSFIATHKFLGWWQGYSPYLVMGTYILAQMFIIRGLYLHYKVIN